MSRRRPGNSKRLTRRASGTPIAAASATEAREIQRLLASAASSRGRVTRSVSGPSAALPGAPVKAAAIVTASG
ncbi:MAG: hypothetical protein M5U13_13395 [Thermoanaerobaculia bacterium]|nr:hypothetical protein [Thermoanaerobaculia bacterium]